MQYSLKNGSELKIRDVVVEDAESLLNYLNAVGGETDYLTFGKEGSGFSLEQEEAFIRNKNENEDELFIAGLVDEKIVATLGLVPGKRERVSHCAEFGMSVSKAYWNCGIGSCLMEYMLDWAVKHELRKVNLSVRVDNIRAINLYLKKGFQFEGRNRCGMKIGEQMFDFYYMGKIL